MYSVFPYVITRTRFSLNFVILRFEKECDEISRFCLRCLYIFFDDRDHDCACGRGAPTYCFPRITRMNVSHATLEYHLQRPRIPALLAVSASHILCPQLEVRPPLRAY